MKIKKLTNSGILIALLILFLSVQVDQLLARPPADSSASGFTMKRPGLTSTLSDSILRQSLQNFREHQVNYRQRRNFILLNTEIKKMSNFLAQKLDYQKMRREIVQLNDWRNITVDGVVTSPEPIQTTRNLTTTAILLRELLNWTRDKLHKIEFFHKTLLLNQSGIDSLVMDSILYLEPANDVARIKHNNRILKLTRDLKPVNLALQAALDSVQNIELQVNILKSTLESDSSFTESVRESVVEEFNIYEVSASGSDQNKTFLEVLKYSWEKSEMAFLFYLINHKSEIFLMILFIVATYVYLIMIRRKSHQNNLLKSLAEKERILKYPFASSILSVVTVFQFLLPLPPHILSGFLWIISAVALSVMIRNKFTRFWFVAWLLYLVLFILAYSGYLLLLHSSFERWSILLMSLLGLAAAAVSLTAKRKGEIDDKLILIPIGIMLVSEIFAIYFALTGGYNFSKALMSSGIFSVIIAFLLLGAVRLLNEMITVSRRIFYGTDEDASGHWQEGPTGKIPFYYYILFFSGWFVLLMQNTYLFQAFFRPIYQSLITTRQIGQFSFNFKSILIFFLVLLISALVSQLVSFLASENTTTTNGTKKGGIGSWLLLIRLAIFTAGISLAFMSAGIGMDRVGIILGALSVGIGFGLQSLVNNLVSGLFIAFEKPVNVGDIVDIGGQNGQMKSIGIRSSVITTWNGADVIIPNGDLLNQHLVNWTLGSSKRRYELKIGVAYGTNLARTKQLVLDLMLKDPRILKNPEPFVLADNFDSSSVSLILKFWVAHFSIGMDVKSDLIIAIDQLFREEGIVIPFPRQDVHIIAPVNPSGGDQ